VDGFEMRGDIPRHLHDGLQGILAPLLAAALQQLAASNRQEQRAPDGPLSRRERQVLQLIAAGDSNKMIARRLDISLHTVKRHVANILAKIGVSSRTQAAAWLHAGH
jgi:LuxR family maltose regulon positive regulatory protein